MSLKSRKIQCILCNGVVSLDDNKTRFKEHLDQDHAVIADGGQSWVMAVSLLDQERREKILATIMDNISREPQAESGEQKLLPEDGDSGEKNSEKQNTKVILNIDISDDEADGDWDKNFEKVVSPDKSFVELDESFGENTDQEEKLVSENTLTIESSKDANDMVKQENTTANDENNAPDSIDKALDKKIDLFECRLCHYKSRTSFALKKHLKKHHSVSDTITTDMIIKEEAVQGQAQGEEREEENEVKKQKEDNKTNEKESQLAKKSIYSSRRNKSRSHLPCSDTNDEPIITKNDSSKILEEIDRFSQSLKRKLSPNKTEEKKSDSKRRRTVSKKQDESLSKAVTIESEETRKEEENKKEVRNEKIKKNRRSQKEVQEEVKRDVLQTSKSVDTAVKQEDETIKEDFLNVSPTVDLSGSSYFQFHQTMVKSVNARDIRYESLFRDGGLPINWFVYVSFFNGGKRKVTEYITPDRRLVRGKTATVEFMKASNEYSEGEVKAVADHLGVKFNE